MILWELDKKKWVWLYPHQPFNGFSGTPSARTRPRPTTPQQVACPKLRWAYPSITNNLVLLHPLFSPLRATFDQQISHFCPLSDLETTFFLPCDMKIDFNDRCGLCCRSCVSLPRNCLLHCKRRDPHEQPLAPDLGRLTAEQRIPVYAVLIIERWSAL